jgi:phosphohistidine phosphatase
MAGKRTPLVLLVRHGKAEDAHPLGDGARALTEEGRAQFRSHARKLAGEVKLEGILTSPLVRAVQTAELLADAWEVDQVVVRGELDISRASAAGIEALCRAAGTGWALVGHNPSFGEALGYLLGRRGDPPKFRKGGIAALKMNERLPWELAWMAAPGKKPTTELD